MFAFAKYRLRTNTFCHKESPPVAQPSNEKMLRRQKDHFLTPALHQVLACLLFGHYRASTVSRAALLLRAAVLPAILAWVVGTAILFMVACWSTASDAHARGAAWLGVASPQATLGTILFLLLAYGFGAALVILPTCLLSVVPL